MASGAHFPSGPAQRVTAWRLLHGQLFVGGFTRCGCPHLSCTGQLATLTHVFISCPLAAGVWDWFAATRAAVTGDDAPPRSAEGLGFRVNPNYASTCQQSGAQANGGIREILSRKSGGKQVGWRELFEIHTPTTSGRDRQEASCPRS